MNKFKYDLAITYSAVCEIDGNKYFSCNSFNGLFCMEGNDADNIKYLGRFENENPDATNMHQKAIAIGKVIYFIPLFAKDIAVYNTDNNKMNYIHLNSAKGAMVIDSVLVQKIIWIFYSKITQGIVCVDTSRNEVIDKISYEKDIQRDIRLTNQTLFFNPFWFEENYAYCAIWNTNCFFRFNFDTKEQEWVCTGAEVTGFAGMTKIHNKLFFTALNDTSIYSYDVDSKLIQTYRSSEICNTNKKLKYPLIVNCAGKVIIIPQNGPKLLTLCETDKSVCVYKCLPDDYCAIGSDVRFLWKRALYYDLTDNEVVIYPYSCGYELHVNPVNEYVNCLKYAFNQSYIEDTILEYKKSYEVAQNGNQALTECVMYNVDDFIDSILKKH